MKFTSLSILAIFFAVLFFCTCKKDVPVEQTQNPSTSCGSTTTFIDTFLIKNFLFNSGSYWVYQDSVNNSTDSCYNLGSIKQMETYYAVSCPGNNCAYNYRCGFNNITNYSSQYGYSIRSGMLNIFSHYAYAQVFLFGVQNDAIVTNNNVQLLSNYTINTLIFDSVYKCSFNSPAQYLYTLPDSGVVYLKPGVGLIRTDFYEAGQRSSYKLLRYNIQ